MLTVMDRLTKVGMKAKQGNIAFFFPELVKTIGINFSYLIKTPKDVKTIGANLIEGIVKTKEEVHIDPCLSTGAKIVKDPTKYLEDYNNLSFSLAKIPSSPFHNTDVQLKTNLFNRE